MREVEKSWLYSDFELVRQLRESDNYRLDKEYATMVNDLERDLWRGETPTEKQRAEAESDWKAGRFDSATLQLTDAYWAEDVYH